MQSYIGKESLNVIDLAERLAYVRVPTWSRRLQRNAFDTPMCRPLTTHCATTHSRLERMGTMMAKMDIAATVALLSSPVPIASKLAIWVDYATTLHDVSLAS